MPKEAADNALTRARALLSYSQDDELPKGVAEDLVRTALVMGVAAIDTYLHAAVLRTVRAWRPTASLAKLEIRFNELCLLVERVAKDRREDANSRPWVRVKDALQERLLKVTFQSSREVETALAMCGVKKGWNKITTERKIGATALKQRLDPLVHRRNRIVRESDQQRTSRPRGMRLESIDPGRVKRDLNWVDRLIAAIDAVLKPRAEAPGRRPPACWHS
jgi:hypothetical protein